MAGGEVQLIALCKSYDDVPAVKGIDLHIHSGEFFSLLGPSGCGKTTTLRMLAGFERPNSGSILVDGRDLAAVPPNKRPVNTVFQNYALFPFLDVFDNVAFGLRYADVAKADIKRCVEEALALVRMEQFAHRRPAQLSGGQQQRIALARALVLRPAVLLLDEPLGALDAKLRKTLQVELKTVQESLGITFVYVTHDQEEALTMSDRLAVMNEGLVQQVGTPEEVYQEPASVYVADFLGSANALDVEVPGPLDDGVSCRLGPHTLHVDATAPIGAAKAVVRLERVAVEPTAGTVTDTPSNTLAGLVDRVIYLGPTTQLIIRLADGQALHASVPNDGVAASETFAPGTAVRAHISPDAVRILPVENAGSRSEGHGPSDSASGPSALVDRAPDGVPTSA